MNLYHGTITKPATYKKDVFDKLYKLAQAAGVGDRDGYHLCYAEASDADYLLTTDGDFVDCAAGLGTKVKVVNPLTFMQGGFI
jgi:predicted nuclease of predicted toxin-antitoxin system